MRFKAGIGVLEAEGEKRGEGDGRGRCECWRLGGEGNVEGFVFFAGEGVWGLREG